MSKSRFQQWVVKLADGAYLTRDGVTRDREAAHSYHYKEDAVTAAKVHPAAKVGRKYKWAGHDELVSPVKASFEKDVHWDAYTFSVGGKNYFLPHTTWDPFWELMEDVVNGEDQEYVSVAKGATTVKAWLLAHGVEGVPIK